VHIKPEIRILAIDDSALVSQIRVIMLDGVTYGGFNVVDITKLQRRTGLPIIVVMRSEPDMGRIRDAMQNLPDADRRWQSLGDRGA